MAIVDRVSTPKIDLQEAFSPKVDVVSSYVRPATPDKSPLWDLAEGLSVFSQGLRSLMSKRRAEEERQAAVKGEAEFYKNNSVGYSEAVRQGKIPAFQSPEFVSGYKRAEGAALGKRMMSKFELAYSQWPGRNGQDPAAFDKFVGDFMTQNITSDDPDILEGAMPYIENLTNRGYQLNTQERADGMYNGSLTAHIASSDQDVDLAVMSGTAKGTGVDLGTTWEALMANRDAALSTGIRDEDYDKKLIDLVIAKAAETGESDLLKLLDNPVPGQTYTYATTDYGRDEITKAKSGIEVAKRTAEERQYQADKRADEAMKDQLEAYAIDKLAADPNYAFDEAFLTEYSKYDPQARINVKEWGRKLAAGTPEDQEDVMQLYGRILQGEDPGAVVRQGMAAGVITTPETLKSLIGFKGDQKETNRFLQNSVYKSAVTALRQAAMPETEFFNPDAMSPAAVAVQLDYEKAMTQFINRNPDASDIEISEEATRVYGVLSKGIAEPGKYATPTEAGVSPNPIVPDQQQVADQAAADAALKATTAGQMDVWAGQQAPQLDALPPEERKQLEEAAASMGIDPAVLAERTWKKVQQMLQSEQSLNQTGDQIGGILDRAAEIRSITGDGGPRPAEVQAVSPILDLLGATEGTDKGRGYNETLGYGSFTGGPVDLTTMSLNEVRQLQKGMLSNPANTFNSSAVGRYQIVGQTLQRLMQRMGLSGSETFTPELQDAMALELMRMRGLDMWLSGEMTTDQFINGLSEEWASVPNSAGNGSYAGQRVGIDLAGLKKVLATLRPGA